MGTTARRIVFTKLVSALLPLTIASFACSSSDAPSKSAQGDDAKGDDDVADDDGDDEGGDDDEPSQVDASKPGNGGTRADASTAPSTPDGNNGNNGGKQDAEVPRDRDAGGTPPRSDAATASDAAVQTPSEGGADAPATPLPAITDPAMPGPFGVQTVATAPGLSSHTLIIPEDLGKDGLKHPVIVWTNGNGASASFYDAFLRHFASHGFFMVVDKRSTSMRETEYAEQKKGIDWAEMQAKDGPYAGKIDANRIGIMGHSMGSLSSFVNGPDPRVKTTIHWSGGLVGNPTGTSEDSLAKLHAPAAFLCGGADSMAGPACANDFRDAPKQLPVFYATLAGVGHIGVFADRNGGEYGRVGVAWMRWKLAGDPMFRDWFAGSACKACMRPWTAMSRNLD